MSIKSVAACGACLLVLVGFTRVGSGADSSALVAAVKSGDRGAARTLLRQRTDPNSTEADGTTALHWAAQNDDAEMVRLLVAAHANAKTANRYGVTPLHLAVVNGNSTIATALLEAGADPNAALPEGETVLMTAARTGRVDAVRVLLDRGAHLAGRDRWFGETALIWAAAENHPDVVALLIERGADVNSRSALLDVPKRRTGQSILSLGSWTPLMYSARENALEAGRTLVAKGAGLDLVDPDGATALVIAIINANYEFATFLLEAGADPNVVDKEAAMGPLYAAIDMHRLAIGHGRPNPKPSGLLDSQDIVRILLARKADPNTRLKAPIMQRHHTFGDTALGQGATPFMRAAKSGDIEIMRLLLAAGADPTLTMPNHSTALMFTSGLGWRDGSPLAPSFDRGTDEEAVAAIALLLELGLDVNAATDNGETALHVAATGRGSPTIVRYLIERGADLHAQNKRGQTPLAAATSSRKELGPIVEILSQATRQP